MSKSPISYQLHSRNDLREWNALFRKGGTSLKIDPHFMPDNDEHFILSHDAPAKWKHRRNRYSTLDDVLLYMQSAPAFLHSKRIDIALCFKSVPFDICAPSDTQSMEARQWMQMANSFFSKADEVVREVYEKSNITLTFILDGDGKPCRCLADKFLPWQSVFIESDKCSRQCYNSTQEFCERFVILNNPTSSDWERMATPSNHYGKFGLSNHTLQVWEPDSQWEISSLVNSYMEGRRRGVPSGSGLAFAINIDFSMLSIFTSRVLSGTDAHGFNVLIQQNKPTGEELTAPTLQYINPGEMTLHYWSSHNTTYQGQIMKRQIIFRPFTHIQVNPPSSSGDRDAGNSFSYRRPFNTSIYESGFASPPYNRLQFKNYHLIRKLLGKQHENSENVRSWGRQVVGDYSFLFVAVEGKMYATTRRRDEDYNDFRLIGLGTSVHASSLNDTLLIVTEGNHCYNSHGHNTRASPLVCRPQVNRKKDACPYSLDYSVGTAENWFLWLQRGDAVVTSCNEFILHGTFTGGRNPSVALFPLGSSKGKVGVMVAHEPYPSIWESKCGTPMRREQGIIISSFATTVVKDRYIESFRYTESLRTNFSDFDQLKLGVVVGIVVYWLVAQLKKRKRDGYTSIDDTSNKL